MGIEAVAIAGLVAGGVGTAASIQQQRQSQSQQKKALAAQRRADEIKATQAKIQSVREASIKRAQLLASTAASGAQFSSGALGGISSVGSQLEGQFQTAGRLQEQNVLFQNAQSKALQAQTNAGLFGDIAGLGFQVAGTNFSNSDTTPTTGGQFIGPLLPNQPRPY